LVFKNTEFCAYVLIVGLFILHSVPLHPFLAKGVMSNTYREYPQLDLPGISREVLAKWQANQAFEKSVSLREGHPAFVFYEGPPSANGMPGIHHVISRTLKDLVCRYKTMQGFQVTRKGGWDTHGLPVELGVEKELGITKEDIGVKISVEEYNLKCREVVMRYKDKWDAITQQMGYWVDLNDPYITFDNKYIETLWWCLSQLYQKGYLYESVSIQPYSPAAGTGLSSHELNQPGTYKNVKDTSATVMFRLLEPKMYRYAASTMVAGTLIQMAGKHWKNFDQPDKLTGTQNEVFVMAWTTTPWTLPSNLGLTLGGDIEYVLVASFNPYTHLPVNVILAKDLVHKYFYADGQDKDLNSYVNGDKHIPWTILHTVMGKELEYLEYEQLLPFEANTLEAIQAITPGATPFRIVLGDFVTTTDGTGIVHTAPAFGADDFKTGRQNNMGILTLVDREGKFVPGTGEYSGRFVKNYKDDPAYEDVNVDIAVGLKLRGQAFKVEKYEHSYPHCWRTDKPIIYYPLDAWFIRTTALKDRMVELNKTINWKPPATGEGRFGNWLENMVDWNLSRSRFWGTPLPIWETADGSEERCIGSIEELNTAIREASAILGGDTNKHYLHDGILDLHKPYVDEIILVSPTGQPMKRVPDLIDVWFDSGAMPYAQHHFPFEHKDLFARSFPADFIAEGVDQTRGWFYTLHALGALLKESVEEALGIAPDSNPAIDGKAYKTVVSNGLVLDKNGNKMSKRLGNVVDPFQTIADYGADATRWYLITNASPWDSLRFDPEGIREVQRKFFGTLYNTYQFFALYANVDGFRFAEARIPLTERPELDRWILSALNSLVQKVTAVMDDYEPTQAGRAIEEFVDGQLSNWYVRLCRRRFWKGEYEHDKICAYQTLYECLETLCRLIAPIAPFFADWLFVNLNSVTRQFARESVHHTDFPVAVIEAIDTRLEQQMLLAQDTASLILSIRKKVNIKVRQPLRQVTIPALDQDMIALVRQAENIIKAETNIKTIEILPPDNTFIRKKAKANFKTLGKRLGSRMKWAAEQIGAFDNATIGQVLAGSYTLNTDILAAGEEPIVITSADLEISTDAIPGYEIAAKGSLTVALDITITEDLKREGDAREFVNRIQNLRKEAAFELTDRIIVTVSGAPDLLESLRQYNAYICAEILADSLDFVPVITDGTEIEVNDVQLIVNVTKKGA
jgi:isoleucyl-tRNA synthetase